MGENASNAVETESDRRRLLDELDAEYGPEWSRINAPGSFGCHELLDRTNLIGDLVEGSLLNHPACVGNPEWFALASQAVESLRELYQRIGQDHPEAPVVRSENLSTHKDPLGGGELFGPTPERSERSRSIQID